jgi:hypothetical protein
LPPGILKQEISELLGMTPEERTQVQTALRTYYSTVDGLIQDDLMVTNVSNRARIPKDAVATHVYEFSPLGESAKESGDQLLAALQHTLGDDRWQIIHNELRSSGPDTLRNLLLLDAETKGQELALWVEQNNGNYEAGYFWTDRNSSMSGGFSLKECLPDAPPLFEGSPLANFEQYSRALSRPARAWLQQQATDLLASKGGL